MGARGVTDATPEPTATGEVDNPYSPPRASIDPEEAALFEIPEDLASLKQRFVAAVLDAAFVLVPCWLFYELVEPFVGHRLVIAIAAFVAVEAIQWNLVARRGQPFGKVVTGTRIVRAEDRALPDFHHGVVVRDWVRLILSPTPLGLFFCAVDVLFVFRRDRRCVHDHLAGTMVIRL
jgi:uncharacterized RDD family membrane protein YckC